jgi:hypothetical protein
MSHLAIIGGSGFAAMSKLEILDSRSVATDYGQPSAHLIRGRLAVANSCSCPGTAQDTRFRHIASTIGPISKRFMTPVPIASSRLPPSAGSRRLRALDAVHP